MREPDDRRGQNSHQRQLPVAPALGATGGIQNFEKSAYHGCDIPALLQACRVRIALAQVCYGKPVESDQKSGYDPPRGFGPAGVSTLRVVNRV
jgi:hypothetical protein